MFVIQDVQVALDSVLVVLLTVVEAVKMVVAHLVRAHALFHLMHIN